MTEGGRHRADARRAARGFVDRHGDHGVHRHAGTAARQAPASRLLLRAGRPRARDRRAATTSSRSRWRWSRCPATRSRPGSAATATSSCVPDLATLRRIPWLEATALVLCDVAWGDGSPVRPSPRQVLRAQVERARALGFEVMVGSELEFYLLSETYEEAHRKHYRDLTPSVPYILDYHILATTYDEPLLRQIRNGMQARRHARRDVEGRGVARTAGDQLPLRRRVDDGRQPRDLQERREGDRAPERLLDHVHGEAGSHVDRLVVPHPLVAVARR